MARNKLAQAFERQDNLTYTENMAVTNASTLNKVLDFYYHAPTRQGQDNLPLFLDAYQEDKNLTLKALFYLRDVRHGKGQRKTFRDILQWLAKKEGKVFDALAQYVPEYGRWDDLTELVGFRVVQSIVRKVFHDDLLSTDGVSLLGKWMPSENASSQKTRELATRWASVLELTPKQYRQALSELRRRIQIVERQMSSQEWDEIDYEHLPARASKLYRNAFKKHDETRYTKFLESVLRGEKTIKAGTVYPHELCATLRLGTYDRTIEAQWQNLPNYFGEEERNILVVVDTSGSMASIVSGRIEAIDVSVGLGIYCAERNRGAFHNYVLNFNDDSHLFKVNGKSLKASYQDARKLPCGGSTNLQSAFDAILEMAVDNEVPQEDMPSDVLVISDMEFNSADRRFTNLEIIQKKFKKSGYECPRLVFWNVQSRHNQVPATQDSRGVLLVSGFSAETVGKVLQSKSVTPLDLMLEVLNSERYSFIDEIA